MNSFNSRLKSIIKHRNSWLCVGLDINSDNLGSSNISKLQEHTFNIIDATRDLAVAYKPNFAFFERWGSVGFSWLKETVNYIGEEHIKIADAKRGDIGNTAVQYAESIFNHFHFDCVTLSPYMGKDSIEPFSKDPEKGVFILCKTSNPSGLDFQNLKIDDGLSLFEKVALWANDLNHKDNIGLVVGATALQDLSKVRNIAPELPFLIPGIGAQGGDLKQSLILSNKSSVGLINISRSINFAGDMTPKAIRSAAEEYVNRMRNILI